MNTVLLVTGGGRGIGDAIEVARAILWLLSEETLYSTGTFIDVAGGR